MVRLSNALRYHAFPTPGKLAIQPTKPCETAHDLSLAYSPGVAEPCLEIAADPEKGYDYTSKGNLVAVISNGTAVLGLGDLGPLASKPVMEGKACLFKMFADIDVFDLELDCRDSRSFIETVAALAPTFGGINLEDIKAPECFEIEEELCRRLSIPVFHDDQHGTAIIASAALINAAKLTGRELSEMRVVVNGAGASALSCAKLFMKLGVLRENMILCDSKGVIYAGRTEGMNRFKSEFAAETPLRTLSEAVVGADVLVGLSSRDAFTPEMLTVMAANPIVFAMANPDPEIDYDTAVATRPDVIMATGRSDYPNQVNNVLGFPFIFRGALDVRASSINDEMKLAAVHAIAELAREPVPETVRRAYGNSEFRFGPTYIIPKPFDPRVLYKVAPAVAAAAIASGVARRALDIETYTLSLKRKQHAGREILSHYDALARSAETPKTIVFTEGSNPRVLTAAVLAAQEGIARPVLLGKRKHIEAAAHNLELDISGCEIVDPRFHDRRCEFSDAYFAQFQRKGVTKEQAARAVEREEVFGSVGVKLGEFDGLICGVDKNYPDTVRPILQIVGLKPGATTAAALYMLSMKDKLFFLADTGINIDMTPEKLAQVALMAAEFASSFEVEPRLALLSYSNFGTSQHPQARLVRSALEKLRALKPDLIVDGEMQVDAAVSEEILNEYFSFCTLDKPANVLV
ncbi:MAG: NADP-dependent malic enzyme, partial [Deltaproteobacteria bacterium]|nr:NADP-dependent malic enzyme [Deltaproteobacteria bacterium]